MGRKKSKGDGFPLGTLPNHPQNKAWGVRALLPGQLRTGGGAVGPGNNHSGSQQDGELGDEEDQEGNRTGMPEGPAGGWASAGDSPALGSRLQLPMQSHGEAEEASRLAFLGQCARHVQVEGGGPRKKQSREQGTEQVAKRGGTPRRVVARNPGHEGQPSKEIRAHASPIAPGRTWMSKSHWSPSGGSPSLQLHQRQHQQLQLPGLLQQPQLCGHWAPAAPPRPTPRPTPRPKTRRQVDRASAPPSGSPLAPTPAQGRGSTPGLV